MASSREWRRTVASLTLALALAGCSSLSDEEAAGLGPGNQTEAPSTVTANTPTTAATAPDSSTTSTAAPTSSTDTPTTSTTDAPTTSTTDAPMTSATETEDAGGGAGDDTTLPRTGPSEAALFVALGSALLVVGRGILDALGWLDHLRFSRIRAAEELPPR